jgi:hypothetical protein
MINHNEGDMVKTITVLFALAITTVVSSCATRPHEYSFVPGQPSAEIRNTEWEGFSDPAATRDQERIISNFIELQNNPRVLWIIADTYGNKNEMDSEWVSTLPWFFNSERIRFIEPEGTPNQKQHWHGFGCYSRGWPLLYRIPNVDVVLFRMIDVMGGENALLDFIEGEMVKYNGRIVVSNSWGIPRKYNQWDSVIAITWGDWVNRIDKMSNEYPSFTVVFSSGNSGPDFSGFPQSLIEHAVLVGATDKMGNIASFSSQDKKIFCVAGGHRTYVADPDNAGRYMVVSGTSFSCPTVAAMIVKLFAENPSWGRHEALEFLSNQVTPSPEAKGFNTVWGKGELEQFNQTVPEQTWRDLGYPKGMGARIRNWVTPTRIIKMPEPMPITP